MHSGLSFHCFSVSFVLHLHLHAHVCITRDSAHFSTSFFTSISQMARSRASNSFVGASVKSRLACICICHCQIAHAPQSVDHDDFVHAIDRQSLTSKSHVRTWFIVNWMGYRSRCIIVRRKVEQALADQHPSAKVPSS